MPETNRPSDGFKIRFDDNTTVPEESPILSGSATNRVAKLSRRITLLAIAIPLLVGAILYFAYTDIKGQLNQTQHAGSAGVVSLSKDLESRFSNLSIKQAKLEEALKSNSAALEKSLADLNKRLNGIDTAVETKADSKTLADEIAKFQEAMATRAAGLKKELTRITILEKELARISELEKKMARITELEKELTRVDSALGSTRLEVADAIEKIEASASEINTAHSQMDQMAKGKVDRQSLQKALDKEKVFYTQSFNQLNRGFDDAVGNIDNNRKNIDISQGKLIELQRRLRKIEERLSRLGAASSSRSSNSSTASPSQNLLEQNIDE
jgi:chromosome segregation ATPase